MRTQPVQFMHVDGLREEVVDDCSDEFGGGVTREAGDDKTGVRETEVGERGGVGAIEEAGGARGGG